MSKLTRFHGKSAALPLCVTLMGGSILLSGCGDKTQQTTQTASAPEASVATPAPEASTVADPAPIVDPPKVAAGASGSDNAPLAEAAAVADQIKTGTAVTRVRDGDGWAWMREGHVIRTASADGRRISYYRNGAKTPYLVQDHDQIYAYANGVVSRQYDKDGRGRAPDATTKRQGHDAAQAAIEDRRRAEEVSDQRPGRGAKDDDHSAHQGQAPAPEAGRQSTDAARSDHQDNKRTEGANQRQPNTAASTAIHGRGDDPQSRRQP